MTAYLTDHRPVRDQWYHRRNRPLTGCTVLHTAESVMDTLGPDTGAEAVAEFIRTRTTAGSYHDLCDSDSAIYLVDYNHGAYHDGTGSNNWALSISWACRTSDWARMSAAKRKAFLRQGAFAFARQQAYRRSIGAPLTELRLISKAQSDRGESGFTYHGLRDPGRRTDPGVAAPNLFPFEEFLAECRAVLGGATTPNVQEDELNANQERLLQEIHNMGGALISVAARPIEAEARLNVRLDALTELVRQLAERHGQPIDMDAIEAVVEKGVQDAIAGIETTVTVKSDA